MEGEGALHLTVEGDRVIDLRLEIYEPPRFFEAFLRGRAASELADLVARICGICPVAYQMSTLHAVESIFQVRLHPSVRALRRLYYCGEWIESHLLHMYFLAAPDYLGVDDGIAVARFHPGEVERGLRLRKLGNRILSLLGGRPVNPVGACIGGFSRTPTRVELEELAEEIVRARGETEAALRFFASLPVPSRPQAIELVSLRHPLEYPMNEGRIVSSTGLDIEAAEFATAFSEHQVPHSTALHCRRIGGGRYLVGPLARLLQNSDRLSPSALAARESVAARLSSTDPYASVFARAIEVIYAFDEALRVIREFEPPPRPAAEFAPRAGVGHGATEAPRGLLYVRVETDDRGYVSAIRIVPPTAQNQACIEADLRELAPGVLALPHEQARRACEMAIRNYDPCISCSTHFLTLEIERRSPA
ncbi:MAG TPA: nickel-dependent hydrogenase large subunit [Myxococcota bacterium]|nr:nickel-dependent hydrogenase large subunit [Myxococcota bacterium]